MGKEDVTKEALAPGARRACAALEKRAQEAERRARDAEARAKAAEALVEQLQAGFARLDRIAETLDQVGKRVERLEKQNRGEIGRRTVPDTPAVPDRSTASGNDDILAGAAAIAAWFGFSEASTRHRIRKGEIPTFRMGGTICARRSTLLAWMAEQEEAKT